MIFYQKDIHGPRNIKEKEKCEKVHSCSLARTIVDFFVNLIFHIHILEDVENMKDEVAEMDKEINENQAHEVDDANKMGKMTRR